MKKFLIIALCISSLILVGVVCVQRGQVRDFHSAFVTLEEKNQSMQRTTQLLQARLASTDSLLLEQIHVTEQALLQLAEKRRHNDAEIDSLRNKVAFADGARKAILEKYREELANANH